ncbi:hypothetical protein A6770_14765 [Nostoc minutum NIES-26]|uniref:Uncharacterized protein n=1 Tax=Nostoc minutum NIES-26 TaxID=1844469 RepID=A0A367RNX5_9NOSO|nr:hypothetical protein A6770_14765 [Nostoc minutum NIES-26]
MGKPQDRSGSPWEKTRASLRYRNRRKPLRVRQFLHLGKPQDRTASPPRLRPPHRTQRQLLQAGKPVQGTGSTFRKIQNWYEGM